MIFNTVKERERTIIVKNSLEITTDSRIETPVFPLGIAALRRRNPGEKMVAGSIPFKGHF